MWRENTLSMRSEQGGEERSELLIDVQQMSKIYNEGRENEVRALDNISLSVRWGEFLCIVWISRPTGPIIWTGSR